MNISSVITNASELPSVVGEPNGDSDILFAQAVQMPGGGDGCDPKDYILEQVGNLVGALATESQNSMIRLHNIINSLPAGHTINVGQLRQEALDLKAKAQQAKADLEALKKQYQDCNNGDDNPLPNDFAVAEQMIDSLINDVENQIDQWENDADVQTIDLGNSEAMQNFLDGLEAFIIPIGNGASRILQQAF